MFGLNPQVTEHPKRGWNIFHLFVCIHLYGAFHVKRGAFVYSFRDVDIRWWIALHSFENIQILLRFVTNVMLLLFASLVDVITTKGLRFLLCSREHYNGFLLINICSHVDVISTKGLHYFNERFIKRIFFP